MENKEKTLGYMAAWKLNLRAWGIWQKLCPQVFVSILLSSVVKAVTPYVTIFLSARIIDELSGARRPDQLLRWVVLTLACTAACALLQGVLTRWSNYAKGCAGQLDDQLYMDKMVALDYADVDRQAVFDLYAQIRQNENWAGWGIRKTISYFESFVTAVVQVLGGVGLSVSLFLSPVPAGSGLAFLNHSLSAAAILGLMLLAAVVSPMCANRASRYWTDYAATVRLTNRILGFYPVLGMHRSRAADVRIYKQHENVCEPYLDQSNDFVPGSYISRLARGPMGLLNALSQCVSVALTALVYVFVCLKAWAGAFGVGYITQYVGAITQLFRGLSALLETMGQIRANGTFLQLNFEYLDIPNRMYQGSLTTEKRSDRKYEVEFRDVSFRYEANTDKVLDHVSLRVPAGSYVALAGSSGGGKTTLCSLIPRFYDVTSGSVCIDGKDVRDVTLKSLRGNIGIVQQDVYLFAGTVMDNILYGRPDASREEVIEAAKKANAHDFIMELPDGYDTDIGQRGVKLSGGQKQRLSIARAVARRPLIYIFDDTFSALDFKTDAALRRALGPKTENSTVFIVAQRISTILYADQILVLDDEGRLVGKGTHKELLASCETYRQIARSQLSESELKEGA